MVEVLGAAGLHFVVADAEHGPIDPETCQQMCRAADARGIPLIVRVGESNSPATVCRFLDTGAAGIHLPRVNSVETARAQFQAVFHPPAGARGLSGGRWAFYGSAAPLPDLVSELPSSLLIVVQIEELEAIANLEEILGLEEPDVYFVGPTDLASSMGLFGDKSDSQVIAKVEETIERIVAAGKTAGILASSLQDAAASVRLGVRYLAFNGESLAVWGAQAALSAALPQEALA
jgi:4-hydroxy-2-oxoheptanedioate aldolase